MVEVRNPGVGRYRGKIRRDCGEGKYDIAYDVRETLMVAPKLRNMEVVNNRRDMEVVFCTYVEAQLIRKLSLLDIAKERGHSSVVALLKEHQKRTPREPRRRRRGEGGRGPGIPASGLVRASRRLRANTRGDGVQGRGRGGRSATQPPRRG